MWVLTMNHPYSSSEVESAQVTRGPVVHVPALVAIISIVLQLGTKNFRRGHFRRNCPEETRFARIIAG